MRRLLALALALGGTIPCFGASAQTAPRIKAVVVSFDGNSLSVMPEGESQAMRIAVRPATRILKEEPKTLADIRSGDFIGATLTRSGQGAFEAQEVHIFPAALKGSGEGLYPAAPGDSRTILNGTAAEMTPSTLTVKFRGASGEGTACTGRASLNPLLGCQGTATIALSPRVPVLALVPGDKSLLLPGAVLAISILAGPDGRPVTPGLTVESVTSPAPISAPAKSGFRPSPGGRKP